MRKISFVTILFFSLQLINAQEIKEVSIETDTINENSKKIPFIIINEVPIYPGCENLSLKDRKHCLNKSMQKHVARKFNASVADTLGLSQGTYKLYVFFRINELGLVDSIKTKAPHPALESESVRIARLLPKMIPAKSKGENVSINYVLPINFNVDKPKRKRKRKNRN